MEKCPIKSLINTKSKESMPPARNLQYSVINEGIYHGQGHIINIAKRHTNRRWRQFTPQKQCNIQLELIKTAIIKAIQLKGFGTYIVEISFKNADNKLVTKLKYNFNFQDEAIKQEIVCETETGIKYVDVKLINNELNPRRMGINHFFMKGNIIKKEGQQDDGSEQENKKKRKKGTPNEVWVRQKRKGEDDPWGLDEVSQDEEPQWKVKGSEIVKNVDKGKGKKKNPENQVPKDSEKGSPFDVKNTKTEKCLHSEVKNEVSSGCMTGDDTELTIIAKSRKKLKPNEMIEEIKLQLSKNSVESKSKETIGKSSRKFEQQFKLQKQRHQQTENENKKVIPLQETDSQKKQRIKNELIEKLKAKMQSKAKSENLNTSTPII